MTGYLGDANTAAMWSMPGLDGELLFRYIASPRWAFKTNLYAGSLRGDSSKMENDFPMTPTGASRPLSTRSERPWS